MWPGSELKRAASKVPVPNTANSSYLLFLSDVKNKRCYRTRYKYDKKSIKNKNINTISSEPRSIEARNKSTTAAHTNAIKKTPNKKNVVWLFAVHFVVHYSFLYFLF